MTQQQKQRFLIIATLLAICYMATASIVNIGDDKPMDPIPGRICGIADMNKDGNTDLIVQQRVGGTNKLVVYMQSEQADFKNSTQTIDLDGNEDVFCSVGDFNGDSCPDLLVVQVCSNCPHQGRVQSHHLGGHLWPRPPPNILTVIEMKGSTFLFYFSIGK